MALLIRIFLGKNIDYKDQNNRTKIGVMSGILGVFINLFLFGFKYLAGFLSKSMAIMADSFNNLTDSLSSLVTAIGFKISGKKADNEHPFGHGRMEYIAALIVGIVILIVGFELSKTSIEKIINPTKTQFGVLQIVILSVSIFVKIYMAIYNRHYGAKINSLPMKAVFKDSLNDVITTSAVLLCFVFDPYFSINLDGVFGLGVAILILIGGFQSISETISTLLGGSADKNTVKKIEDYIKKASEKYDYIVGMHDLIIHDYGPGRAFFSLHVEVDSKEDIFLIHEKIDEIENELSKIVGGECVIHMDPVLVNDEKLELLKSQINEILYKIDPELSKHDLRVVNGKKRKNIIFDVVRPFNFKISDKELKQLISKELKDIDKRYNAIVKLDYPFV